MLSLKSQRGHGHLLLFAALVVAGVGAVGYGVYKNSNGSLANASATSAGSLNNGASYNLQKAATNSSKKAALVVYGEQGTYTFVKIKAVNMSSNDLQSHRCGGKFGSDGVLIKALSKKDATKLACSPVAGDNLYYVYFGKSSNSFNKTPTVANVDTGYCLNVHADPTKTTEQTFVGAANMCVAEADVPVQADTTLTIKPVAPKTLGSLTSLRAYIGIASTQALNKKQCAGQLAVKIDGGLIHKDSRQLALRSVEVSSNSSGLVPGYCVAAYDINVKQLKLTPGGTYTLSAQFNGSPYLKPAALKSLDFVVPKAAAKTSTVTGGAAAH